MTTIKPHNAEDIAHAMADILADNDFMGIYRAASFNKQAGQALESFKEDLSKTKTPADAQQAYTLNLDSLTKEENTEPGTIEKANQLLLAHKRGLGQPGNNVPANDGQYADDTQCAHDDTETCEKCGGQDANDEKLPTGSNDPIEGIPYGNDYKPRLNQGEMPDDPLDLFNGKSASEQYDLLSAADFTIKHLSKIASALDAAGFDLYADYIDIVSRKIAETKPQITKEAGKTFKAWLKDLKKNDASDSVLAAFEKRYEKAVTKAKKDGMKTKQAEAAALEEAVSKLPKKFVEEDDSKSKAKSTPKSAPKSAPAKPGKSAPAKSGKSAPGKPFPGKPFPGKSAPKSAPKSMPKKK